MKKLFYFFTLTTMLLPLSVSAQFHYPENWKKTVPADYLQMDLQKIRLIDKETNRDITLKEVNKVAIHTSKGEVILQKKLLNEKTTANYTYNGIVEDSMYIEIDVNGYQGEKFLFKKAIHRKHCASIVIPLCKESGFTPNEIIVEGDKIEVTIEGKKEIYNASKLQQSADEDILQTLCRLPDFKVSKKGVTINGKSITHFYVDMNNCSSNFDMYKYEVLLKKLQKYAKTI